MSGRSLLIVDDDRGLLQGLKWQFSDYAVLMAGDRASALREIRGHRPPVVTLDLGLPPHPDEAIEGLRTLEEILSVAPETKVIVVTGNDDRQNAVQAIALGAYDFYQKPIESEILPIIVKRAYNVYDLEAENRRLNAQREGGFHGLIASDPGMLAACRTIEKVAPTDINVLILGESGTGKELMARALHTLSSRRNGPMIAINCAAIPEPLLESELFGHERGAFTGAVRQVKGKIELANRGTLFLDEIGDMPMSLQAKLLRFIQERIIQRIGGRDEIPVDVRIVCATHRDLAARSASGEFREDLFYRINEITVQIPPLRERGDDAVLMAKEFAETIAAKHGKKRPTLSSGAITAIRKHHWTGNVRELENRVKRAVILADNSAITAADLDLSNGTEQALPLSTLRQVRDAAERSALANALAETSGNLSATAKILAVSRPTLYSLMRYHGIR